MTADDFSREQAYMIGRRRISQFIEDLVRPHVLGEDLEAAYRQMAQDEAREAEVEALGAVGPERVGGEVHRDEIEAAEVIEVGMAQHNVIDVHDFLRPQIRRDDSLAGVEVAVGAAGVDEHHARAGKSDHRAIALAY